MTTRESISTQQKVAGNFVLALGTSVWATHFLVTDYLLQNWDPYFVTAGRLLSATFFLMTAYTLQARGRPLRRIPWRPTLMLSTAGIAVSTVCLTLGVKHAGPVSASIVAATAPIVAAFVARVVFRASLSAAVLFGAVIAVADEREMAGAAAVASRKGIIGSPGSPIPGGSHGSQGSRSGAAAVGYGIQSITSRPAPSERGRPLD